MKPIVVLGQSGQLAKSLQNLRSDHIIYLSRLEAPFEDFLSIEKKFQEIKPSCVINAAAYTQVDLAETEEEKCFLINSAAPIQIAKWCAENHARFIHFSTDYVFNGAGEKPWQEVDSPEPLNVYGKSKLQAEREILKHCPRSLIFRTSWVYSQYGHNFVKTMLKLFKEREELRVVCDQIGAPNYAEDLARAVWQIVDMNSNNFGLYHMSSQKFCSWYDFALKIKEIATEKGLGLKIKKIIPIPTREYKTPAQRPLNSRLDSSKLENDFGIQLPNWDISLQKCLENLL